MNDRLPHEKGFHISWDQIHRDSRALAWRLDGHGPDDGNWRAVVAITRGGMAPAMIVARELDIHTIDGFQAAVDDVVNHVLEILAFQEVGLGIQDLPEVLLVARGLF